MVEINNNDFKYVLQDLSKIYIGARFCYKELMERDDIPFKLKAIFGHYILKEVDDQTRISDHVFFCKDTDLTFMVFKQLKAQFKISNYIENQKNGKCGHYESRLFTIEQILQDETLRENQGMVIVEEMMIKKISMMAVEL